MATYTSQPDGASGIDAHIGSFAPTTNYATNNVMYVGETTGDTDGNQSCFLIKFDLSSIPASSIISSATLYLTQTAETASNDRTMSVYRCLRAWTEAGVTWNKYDGTNNWGTAGARNTSTDRESSSIGSISLSATEANGEKTITLDAAKIQGMVSGTFTNNGFICDMPATQENDQHVFASSDNATAESRPKLVIEYLLGGQVMIWSNE